MDDPDEPLLTFKSHVDGKNSDVAIHVDRVEWKQAGHLVRRKGSEVIPVKSISSVSSKRDGMINTKVVVICSGNTIEFRVPHSLAPKITAELQSLMLDKHPDQQTAAPPSAAAEPDIMDQLRQLAELRDSGVINEADFEAKKSDLLGRL